MTKAPCPLSCGDAASSGETSPLSWRPSITRAGPRPFCRSRTLHQPRDGSSGRRIT